ncbi:zinc-dependent metalloprotease [Desertihabitans aurantiacus]|uniref:zinc-dependent metalloprotease n=1 Tax=Desertihabitans aurantiacus TaxID=2282477 RepID=UPI000DF8022D|nr:zinc-dependent metalloprotease [Desertihabitans aurantiacus]
MADDRSPGDPDEPRDRDEQRDEGGREQGGTPQNPFEALFGSFGAGGQDMQQMMGQLQQMIAQLGMGPGATADSGVDWEQAKDVARKVAAGLGPDRTPDQTDRRRVTDAASLAQTWLDPATAFSAEQTVLPAVWSRAEWIEHTMPVWRRLVEPVADSMAEASAQALMGAGGDDPAANPLAGMAEMLRPMLRRSGNAMFAVQLGQALGQLAGEVVGVTDIGVPLTSTSQVVLLPTNVAAFGEGLQERPDDVLLYLTIREAARQRLFAECVWLRPQLLALVEEYARHIRIDMSAIEQAVGEIDLQGLDPQALQRIGEEVREGLFEPQHTPEQQAVLGRMETLLALVEGWVDEVVGQACAPWMPAAQALGETVRRNRAAGGPAEQTFANLVGLELRPRRLRDAANLWAALREARGVEGRDAVWKHPDLVPDAAALDDPIGFVRGDRAAEGTGGGDDLDAELAALLDRADETGEDGPEDPRDR